MANVEPSGISAGGRDEASTQCDACEVCLQMQANLDGPSLDAVAGEFISSLWAKLTIADRSPSQVALRVFARQRLRQNRCVGFTLAGFDERDGTAPNWLPDTEVEDLDDAIAQAEKWIAGRTSVRADVLQVTKRTGRAVLSVTTDGVEKLSPVHRARTADDAELLRQARRRPLTVNSVTIRRHWRSSVIAVPRPVAHVVAAIDEQFGAGLDWVEAADGDPTPRFSYSRGQFEWIEAWDVWLGVNARGSVAESGSSSTLRITFAPTSGSIGWTVLATLFLAMSVFAGVVSTVDGPFEWWSLFGLATSGFALAALSRVFVRHRRQVDIELVDALAGIQRSKETQRQRRRARRNTWRS